MKTPNLKHTYTQYVHISSVCPHFFSSHKFVWETEKFARLLRLACAADVLSRITSRVILVSFVFIVESIGGCSLFPGGEF